MNILSEFPKNTKC